MQLIILIFVVAGIMLLKVGFWPPRRGDTPYCKQCQYNLTGLQSQRCPECGSILTSTSIVHGEAKRRLALTIAGVLLISISLLMTCRPLRHVRWRYVLPASWLMSDLQSGNRYSIYYATQELGLRIKAGTLSTAEEEKLIRILSKRFKVLTDLEDHYETLFHHCLASRLVKPAHYQKVFKHIAAAELRVRPRVAPGDPVPCQSLCITRVGTPHIWMQVTEDEYLLDGQPVDYKVNKSLPGFSLGYCYPNRVQLLPPAKPGRHTLRLNATLKIYAAPAGDQTNLYYQEPVSLEKEFEIFDIEPADYIKITNDDYLSSRSQDCIEPDFFIWHNLPHLYFGPESETTFYYSFDVCALGVNCAFGVYARPDGGEEVYLGPLTIKKGSVYCLNYWQDAPKFTKLDMILRSNQARARETIDLYDVWEGELVFEDIFIGVER